ncbi:dTDP-4-dehydrorhamnose reductase [Magnetospirillum molischianum]|uniref:dTDP-4-dehydrorhamnose reductase n=1 Tax=Magnetospirillum molischianum DSM 120 TaxID=1150626 RepID=H8FS32_MAGML|nr:dTDP-4-dehydrorhamnose reductase [Magnetospirillum molischianum]CCG41170.1 dTDP-4-dehydrorhamnose reductase [Magnetospirillum molischianum DSM 120]
MRVLVTGVDGQVGGAVMAAQPVAGCHLIPANRTRLNLCDEQSIREAMAECRPDVVLNCAAYTAVDRAENETDLAHAINAQGPAVLAELCGKRGIVLLHLSTDYVFDGTKASAYLPDDPVSPLGVYGATKEAGERAVRAACPQHFLLRTSWVYASRGHNFVRTMLRLGRERDLLKVVADQRGSPTAAMDLASALASLLQRLAEGETLPPGTWHITNAGSTTWHGFAEAIFELATPMLGRHPKIVPITTAEYPTPARRPANSVLDCSSTKAGLGISLRHWRDALADVVADIVNQAPPGP